MMLTGVWVPSNEKYIIAKFELLTHNIVFNFERETPSYKEDAHFFFLQSGWCVWYPIPFHIPSDPIENEGYGRSHPIQSDPMTPTQHYVVCMWPTIDSVALLIETPILFMIFSSSSVVVVAHRIPTISRRYFLRPWDLISLRRNPTIIANSPSRSPRPIADTKMSSSIHLRSCVWYTTTRSCCVYRAVPRNTTNKSEYTRNWAQN